MLDKLAAIVSRNRMNMLLVRGQHVDDFVSHCPGRLVGDIPHQIESTFTLHQTDDGSAALLALDGIHLPITHSTSFIDDGSSFINRHRVGNDAALAVFAPAVAFVTLTQMPV